MGLIMLLNLGYFAPEVAIVSSTEFASDYLTVIHLSLFTKVLGEKTAILDVNTKMNAKF